MKIRTKVCEIFRPLRYTFHQKSQSPETMKVLLL